MIQIDENTLKSLGLTLSDDAKPAFIEHLLETLEERVGVAVTELLDDDELEELVTLTDGDDEATTEAWIKQHVPDYEDVVKDEFDILMGEIAEQADEINKQA
jgi:ABC-type proline/glycine betaine transport system substrate-binding protein